MAKNTLTRERLEAVHQLVRDVYLSDSRPWIIGYSGGKDSTTALQLIWSALSGMPREKLTKPVYVISSDTRVETPVIVDYLRQSLDRINDAAKAAGLPIIARLVLPKPTETFWVNMIGRGYPAPYNRFRWCTDRLKINPANDFIRDQVSTHGEVVLVLGVRRAESATRAQVMNLHKRVGHQLSRHSQLVNAWVFTPIEDWVVNDVWTYLLSFPSPWGNNNRDLVAMYKNAQGECPLVVDKTTPSCGNSRFGCWTCTVVDRDKSMENTIDAGEHWMAPLLEFRNWLTATKDPETKHLYRSHRRRTGRVDTWKRSEEGHERLIWGPFTMEFRAEILRRLLRAQEQVRRDGPDPEIELISDEELHEIRRLWRTEAGDWEDTIPKVYREVVGADLDWVRDEDGGASAMELGILSEVASEFDLSVDMLKELVDIERSYRGMARRSRVFDRIESTLKKDWRSADEVFASLEAASEGEWSIPREPDHADSQEPTDDEKGEVVDAAP